MRCAPCSVLLLGLAALSCGSSAEEVRAGLVGTWRMEQVWMAEEDLTLRHNPEGNRWIRFEADGTFVSDGDPFGRNTGRWTLADEGPELYLDSDAGEEDDSYWIVAIDGDVMTWYGARTDFARRFTIRHRRE